MLNERLALVRATLVDLAKLDRGRRVFGAEVHGYELLAPLSEEEVAAFEEDLGVTLPGDYRAFVTQLGSAGAGPFYGLFPLGEMDDGESWEETEFVGDLARPFPYTQAWNWPAERLEALDDAEDEEEESEYFAPIDGAFPIVQEGCALRDLLVVTGPEAGNVWHDARADHGGLVPWGEGAPAANVGGRVWTPTCFGPFAAGEDLPPAAPRPRMTFLDWYERWLSAAAVLSVRALRSGRTPRA